jgi:hypothetical protein
MTASRRRRETFGRPRLPYWSGRELLLRGSSRPPPLPARSQVGARLGLSETDCCWPRFTALSGTERARI